MPDKIHVYEDESGEFRWRRVAPNGEVVSDSGEGYESETGATEAANREADGADAHVVLDSQS
jgi:hypothetical protein